MMTAERDIATEQKLRLFEFLRPNELRHLRLRRAFMKDRKRLCLAVKRHPFMDWRKLSVEAGYKPDTLSSVMSDAMVLRQHRYNYKALIRALRVLDMEPQPVLVEYEENKLDN